VEQAAGLALSPARVWPARVGALLLNFPSWLWIRTETGFEPVGLAGLSTGGGLGMPIGGRAFGGHTDGEQQRRQRQQRRQGDAPRDESTRYAGVVAVNGVPRA
jgi:hypothetical protein